MRRAQILTMVAALVMATCCVGQCDDRFASHWVSYENLGTGIYGTPEAVLGAPTTWMAEPGGPGVSPGTYACSMVYPAWNRALDGSSVVTTIGAYQTPGWIIVEFDRPIQDDPGNWHGMDFIVFGNAGFVSTGYVNYDTNMEIYRVNGSASVISEASRVTVAVSPDNVTWYEYASPKADYYWPTNSFVWNRDTHAWGEALDPTKPVDPALVPANVAGLVVADAIDLYQGSAGGTAFDLAETGFAYIKYLKFTSSSGEVDAIARVGHPLTIAEAKAMPDGMPVSLGVNTVVAGNDIDADPVFADCFYIQSADRTSGIRVTGRTAGTGARVMLSGVMSTVAGERTIKATWVEAQQDN